MICAQDRVQASASARKHAAIAELIRRRPAPGAVVQGPAQMPEGWDEFTARELGAVLGVSAGDAEELLALAWHLEVNLPGTRAMFRAGILSQDKAALIATATVLLDPAEARAAEALVLGRAGSLTPAGLRAAIRRAVMDVNPGHARKRREHAAKRTRVERWAEDSGNAGLAGRELPPADVLAAGQRVTAWARQLRKAGLDGSMDQLRARAFMDLLLGTDSRPLASSPPASAHAPGGTRTPDSEHTQGSEHDPDSTRTSDSARGPAGPPTPAPAGPVAGVIPPGFASRVNMTIPATTVLDLADRPGELAGIGPIDPDPGANTPNRYRTGTCVDRHGGSGIDGPRPGWRICQAACAVGVPSAGAGKPG